MTGEPKSVEAHLARILSVVRPLSPIELTLLDAQGCVLVEDVTSPAALPAFDGSATDGYAVRCADIAGASRLQPVALPVVGDVAAGSAAAYTVQPGLTVRIATGASVPAGADAVVPLELTDAGVSRVAVLQAVASGSYIRRMGQDVSAGQTVLRRGRHLGPAQIGLLAAVGRDRVLARPRPRVVVLSTGSELIEAGCRTGAGQVVDSNSHLLTSAAREAGALAYRVGIVPDDPRQLLDTLEDQLIRADVVITSGGVSAGASDVVKDVLGRIGDVSFDRVALHPGTPQGFGTVGPDGIPFFGLPGNPGSAYVSFELFVRPALRRMRDLEPIERPRVRARLRTGVAGTFGRRRFLPGRLSGSGDGFAVEPVGAPESPSLVALAAADGLIVVPEEVPELSAGELVTVAVLERRQS